MIRVSTCLKFLPDFFILLTLLIVSKVLSAPVHLTECGIFEVQELHREILFSVNRITVLDLRDFSLIIRQSTLNLTLLLSLEKVTQRLLKIKLRVFGLLQIHIDEFQSNAYSHLGSLR